MRVPVNVGAERLRALLPVRSTALHRPQPSTTPTDSIATRPRCCWSPIRTVRSTTFAPVAAEVLDASPERIGRTNPPRLRPDHQGVTFCGCQVHGARQGVPIEDERQPPAGEDIGPVQQPEMHEGIDEMGGTGRFRVRRA